MRNVSAGPSNKEGILIVEDDPEMRSLLVDELKEGGWQVSYGTDGLDALQQLKEFKPSLIITDLHMPYGGFEFLQRLKIACPDCPVVVITAFGDSRTKAMALACGVAGYFDKPVRMVDLKSWIAQNLQRDQGIDS